MIEEKDLQIMVPSKCLSDFWRTLEMPLNHCELNFSLTWSACIVVTGSVCNQEQKFEVNNTKLYVPVVTLSVQGNAKLLHQLKIRFKRTINWSRYRSKPALQKGKRYLFNSSKFIGSE